MITDMAFLVDVTVRWNKVSRLSQGKCRRITETHDYMKAFRVKLDRGKTNYICIILFTFLSSDLSTLPIPSVFKNFPSPCFS